MHNPSALQYSTSTSHNTQKTNFLKETKRVLLPEGIVDTAQKVKFGSFLVNNNIMTGPENPYVANYSVF